MHGGAQDESGIIETRRAEKDPRIVGKGVILKRNTKQSLVKVFVIVLVVIYDDRVALFFEDKEVITSDTCHDRGFRLSDHSVGMRKILWFIVKCYEHVTRFTTKSYDGDAQRDLVCSVNIVWNEYYREY